jgi:hypothetical protein
MEERRGPLRFETKRVNPKYPPDSEMLGTRYLFCDDNKGPYVLDSDTNEKIYKYI